MTTIELKKDEMALIVNEEGQISLRFFEGDDKDTNMPAPFVSFLGAATRLLKDEKFAQECYDYFGEAKKECDKEETKEDCAHPDIDGGGGDCKHCGVRIHD